VNLTFDRVANAHDTTTKSQGGVRPINLVAVCRWFVVAVVGLTVAAAITLNGSETGRLVAAVAGSVALGFALIPILWCVWTNGERAARHAWRLQAFAISLIALAAFSQAIDLLDDRTTLIRSAWIDAVGLAGGAVGALAAIETLRRQSTQSLIRRLLIAAVLAVLAVTVVTFSVSSFSTTSLSSTSNVVIALGMIGVAAFIVACLAASEFGSVNQPQLFASSLALGWLAISLDLVYGGIYRVTADESTKDATSWTLIVAGAFLLVSAIGPAGISGPTAPDWKQVSSSEDAQLSLIDWVRIILPYAVIAFASSAAWAVHDTAGVWLSIALVAMAAITLGRQALIHAGGTRAIERSERALVDLTHRAMVDAVTELPNRRALDDRLAEEVDRALLLKQPLSLCFVDIDHFKTINDVHGHHTGDAILRQVGGLLRRSLRGMDFIGRFGGEEFVVLVPETWSEEAVHLGELLRRAIENAEFISPEKERLKVTVSVGIAGLPEHAHDAALLCIRADEALYSAKRAGRNRVMVFDPNEPVPAI
jgi:diguanylate cyclase (GGDEF)-like protein